MKPILLTSSEAAKLMNISVRKLQQLSSCGRGPRKIKIGHFAMYTYEDILKL
jgi:hypothetical protein